MMSKVSIYCWILLEKLLMVERLVVDSDSDGQKDQVVLSILLSLAHLIIFNSSLDAKASRFSQRILLPRECEREENFI